MDEINFSFLFIFLASFSIIIVTTDRSLFFCMELEINCLLPERSYKISDTADTCYMSDNTKTPRSQAYVK